MSDVKIEMNKAGLHELFTSSAVASLIEQATAQVKSSAGDGYASEVGIMGSRVRQVKSSAGDGYASEVGIMGSRVRGIVYPATKGARDSTRNDHSLQKAVGGG